MRKDIKCTFGILKGRWIILKIGIHLHYVDNVDKIQWTCCALHNQLLDVNRLDEQQDGILTRQWERKLGELEKADMPLALSRIISPADIHAYDTSYFGTVLQTSDNYDVDSEEENGDKSDGDDNGTLRVIRNLSLKYFRSKLIEHLNICFQSDQIVWPQGRGSSKPITYIEKEVVQSM